MQRKAGNDLRLFLLEGGKLCFQLRIFLLQPLIFRTGNGHHFFCVTCLHSSVFHANIIPQNTAKAGVFNGFQPLFLCLDCGQSRYRAVGFRLLNLQPLNEPAVLLRR